MITRKKIIMHLNEAAFSYFNASHLTFYTFFNLSNNNINPIANSGFCVFCVSILQWTGKYPLLKKEWNGQNVDLLSLTMQTRTRYL